MNKKINLINKTLLKRIILFLLLSFVVVFFWINKSNFYPENISIYLETKIKSIAFKNDFPVDLESDFSKQNYMFNFEKNIGVLTNTSFEVISNSGKKLNFKNHNLKNPKCKSNGTRAILYDLSGNDYTIESPTKTIDKFKNDNKIISCDISSIGNYGILSESQENLAELTIYDINNIQKYKYYFSEIYATDIVMDSKGQNCFVSGINIENGKIISSVYYLNFKSEKPINIFKIEENNITNLKLFSNGNILGIGDKYIFVINKNTKLIHKFYYDDKILKFYSFNKDYGIVCCLSNSLNRNTDDKIIILDNFGKNIRTINTDENLTDICHNKNRIIGLLNNKILIYNTNGNFEGIMNTNKVIDKIYLKNDMNIFTLENKKLEKLKINLDKIN